MVSCLGYERSKNTDLWVDKYRPRTLEELAVHKKKVAFFFLLLSPLFTYSSPFLFFVNLQVEQVKLWFQESLDFSKVMFRLSLKLFFDF